MNKKQQSSNKRRKRASIGLAVCFAAAIVLTGAYTWRNYRANVKDEQAKIEEEQQAKEIRKRQAVLQRKRWKMKNL